jgi:hypothetical protein
MVIGAGKGNLRAEARSGRCSRRIANGVTTLEQCMALSLSGCRRMEARHAAPPAAVPSYAYAKTTFPNPGNRDTIVDFPSLLGGK